MKYCQLFLISVLLAFCTACSDAEKIENQTPEISEREAPGNLGDINPEPELGLPQKVVGKISQRGTDNLYQAEQGTKNHAIYSIVGNQLKQAGYPKPPGKNRILHKHGRQRNGKKAA